MENKDPSWLQAIAILSRITLGHKIASVASLDESDLKKVGHIHIIRQVQLSYIAKSFGMYSNSKHRKTI